MKCTDSIYHWISSVSYKQEYRNVLILDKTNSIERSGSVYPLKSMEPLMKCDLCFHVLSSGGIEVLKDRYDEYKRGTVYFGL